MVDLRNGRAVFATVSGRNRTRTSGRTSLEESLGLEIEPAFDEKEHLLVFLLRVHPPCLSLLSLYM